MAVVLPGRHPAFHPIGRLRKSPFKGGKKNLMGPLNLTAMVDMFTVLVIFLLQSFSASGEIMFIQKGIQLPTAEVAEPLEERGPVITMYENKVLIEGEEVADLAKLDKAENNVPELTSRLQKIKEKDEKLHPPDPAKPFDQHAIIQADVGTDFELVRKTIYSINEAGWTHLQFTAMPVLKASDAAAETAAEGG
jgi:biopolymer transport protein ExbD